MKNEILQTRRAVALATVEDLLKPQMWTFRPRFEQGRMIGGFYIARRLIQLPNAQLQQAMGTHGWRLATLTELMLTQVPFTPTEYLLNKALPQPWGKPEYYHANRLFIEQGIGVGDILYGASPVGCWAVVQHGGISVRAGASHNVGIFDDLLDENANLPTPSREQAFAWLSAWDEIGDGGEYEEKRELARDAGYLAGLELEDNEAYLLVKPVPSHELALHRFLIEAQGAKLSEDGGIASRSQPVLEGDTLVVYFAGGGGCSRCAFLEHTTARTYNEDVQALVTPELLAQIGFTANHLEIRLFPEYAGWSEKGLADTPYKLAKRAV